MQGLLNNKCVDLVVLLDFEDIILFCNLLTMDNVLLCSGVCFNHSRGLFQLSDATIKSNKRWSSLSVCSDRKISYYFVLISRNEVKRLSLFILALGLHPIDQQKS